MIKLRRMRWVGNVGDMKRKMHAKLWWENLNRREFGGIREDNIKMDLIKVG
jgi:hypothetical protein